MWLCVGVKVLLGVFFPTKYLLTEEWANLNLFLRFGYLIASVNNKVFTCFIGFSAMECHMIACGQGYQPESKDKEGKTVAEQFNAVK